MENLNPGSNTHNLQPSDTAKLNEPSDEKKKNPHPENTDIDPDSEPVEKLIHKFGQTALIINRLDYYANAIPLGAICNSLSFVLFGFKEAKILNDDSDLLFLILLIFGGIGQIFTGFLEYLKGRTFICTLYMTYGIYFLSFYYVKSINDEFIKVFYGSWAGLTFPLIIGSFKSNLFYLIQTLAICAFFVCRCIGECRNSNVLKEKVSGILELIGGFASFYMGVSQVVNEHFRRVIIPCVPFVKNNEIDIDYKKNNEN